METTLPMWQEGLDDEASPIYIWLVLNNYDMSESTIAYLLSTGGGGGGGKYTVT